MGAIQLIRQTEFYPAGNCFRAASAMVMGFSSIEDMPDFQGYKPGSSERFDMWLRTQGLRIERHYIFAETKRDFLHQCKLYKVYRAVVSGVGPRGCRHCIALLPGAGLLDPHPSDELLVAYDYALEVVPSREGMYVI